VTIEGLTYRFVTLSEHKFFGHTTIQLLNSPVRIAEREKAIVDGFDHPEDRNYAPLDPRGPHEGVRDARWRLIVNIPERQLLEWREH